MSALWEWFKGLPTPAKWGLGIGAGLLVLYIVKSGKGSSASLSPVSQVTPPTDTTPIDSGGSSDGGSTSNSWGSGQGGSVGSASGNGSGSVGSGGQSSGGTVKPTPTPIPVHTPAPVPTYHPTAPTVNRTPSVPVNTTGYGSGAITTQAAHNMVQAIQQLHNPDFQKQKPSPPPEPYTKAVQQVNYNRVQAVQQIHNPDFQKPRPTPKPSYNYSAPSWHPTVQYSTPNRDSGNHNARGRNHAI